ncbi:hypothetical protein [Polaribacter sargassicola]|uniref:hypothetical protein n=1 Tax=Polaribacter sargassicola TaxID=2836891 RepID=UPI001F3C7792|nr:hypothetical protein [Polaribacter sp. DS7-9]MCG1037664.1 hypothetical protein [Polaribacter sp. DS7-9]
MKQLILISFILTVILGCSSSKSIINNNKAVGIKQKSFNSHIPYTYINGYKNYEIKPILSIKNNDSTYTNELRFNAVNSAMYTKKIMYDKFGKWDKEFWPDGANQPILIWEKRKLIKNQNELYSVATNGKESMKEMFASVIVFDSKNQDCLSEDYKLKDPVVNFFATKIKNLSSNHDFYDVYWKMVKEHNGAK